MVKNNAVISLTTLRLLLMALCMERFYCSRSSALLQSEHVASRPVLLDLIVSRHFGSDMAGCDD